jgi:hypothetical protein
MGLGSSWQGLIFCLLHRSPQSIRFKTRKTREHETVLGFGGELGLQKADNAVVPHRLCVLVTDI